MPDSDSASLERTDWRLLLPWPGGKPFSSLVLLGAPPGLADGLRETGVAARVEPDGAGPAPAVAVLSGGPAALARGVEALAPGGVLYGETDDLPAARLALEARGLEILGTWAVWPGFEKPQAYIPLAAPRAIRWFGQTLYPAWTVRKRLLRGSLPLLERTPDRGAGLLMRSFAFTAVKPPADGTVPVLLGHPALPQAVREGTVPLLVTHGRERTVLMPFPREGDSPWGVLKVPRRPTLNGKTVAEQEALTGLRLRLDPSVRSALPVPGGLLGWNGAAVGIESYLPGVSMVGPGLPWRRPSLRQVGNLRLAAAWLTEVHRQTEEERMAWSPEATARWVEPVFEQVRRLGASEREERLFAAAGRRSAALAGVPLPVVWQHRDFTPWNLLRAPGRPGQGDLRVLDWEGARPGLPLCDLLHFVTHWHELARSAFDTRGRLRVFRELWTGRPGSGQAAGAALDAVALYCSRLRIDLRFLPLLLVVTWAELTTRAGSPGRLYLDVLAGHGERLFAEPGDKPGETPEDSR